MALCICCVFSLDAFMCQIIQTMTNNGFGKNIYVLLIVFNKTIVYSLTTICSTVV